MKNHSWFYNHSFMTESSEGTNISLKNKSLFCIPRYALKTVKGKQVKMNFISKRQSCLWFTLLAMTLFAVLSFTLSIQAAEPGGGVAGVLKGQTLYTQFSLFYERNIHLTTNYRKSILVPVNTAVKFVAAYSREIIVTLPDGQKLKIKNIPNFSGETIDGIFTRTFAAKPVDLSRFSETEQKAIMAGEVRIGMSKEAAIIALGYPPKHKTPSLEADQWQYWQSRFDTFIVHFVKGHVTEIQD